MNDGGEDGSNIAPKRTSSSLDFMLSETSKPERTLCMTIVSTIRTGRSSDCEIYRTVDRLFFNRQTAVRNPNSIQGVQSLFSMFSSQFILSFVVYPLFSFNF